MPFFPGLRLGQIGLAALCTALLCAIRPAAAQPRTVPAAQAATQSARLRGLVFLPDAAAVVPGGRTETGIDTSRVPLLDQPVFRKAISGFLDRPLTPALLHQVLVNVVGYARSVGQPFIAVSVPQQQADAGVVQILVLRAKVGQITVKGAKWFSNGSYLSAMHLSPGQPMAKDVLDQDVDWLNTNPYRHAQAEVSAGKQPGTTDIQIDARDRLPLKVFGTFDNTGNESTGQNRIGAGIEYGDMLGLGHIASYSFTMSPDGYRYRGHSLTYTAPLSWRDTLTLSASYVHLGADASALFQSSGYYWQTAIRYDHTLPAIGTYTQGVSLTLAFKSSNNNLLFSNLPVTNTLYDIPTLTLGYNGARPDRWGSTQFDLGLVWGPGNLTGHDSQAAYSAVRAGAHPGFVYATLGLERATRLPFDFSLVNQLRGQIASGNLLGPEQLGVTGYSAVRGYGEGFIYADEGVVIRNEIRTPPIHIATRFIPGAEDALQLLAFYDYGLAISHQNLPGEGATAVAAIGPGIRYRLGRYLTARGDLGFTLHQTQPGQAHVYGLFGVVVSY